MPILFIPDPVPTGPQPKTICTFGVGDTIQHVRYGPVEVLDIVFSKGAVGIIVQATTEDGKQTRIAESGNAGPFAVDSLDNIGA